MNTSFYAYDGGNAASLPLVENFENLFPENNWSIYNPNNDVTLTMSYNSNTSPNWTSVQSQVVSGGLIVPGTITANTLNANQVYAITVQSTNATIGDNNSPGYWFQANTGNARVGGALSIGNNLTIGNNAIIGGNTTIGGVIQQGNLASGVVYAGTINASQINASNLSSISANVGTLTSGKLQSSDGLFVIDLSNKYISISV